MGRRDAISGTQGCDNGDLNKTSHFLTQPNKMALEGRVILLRPPFTQSRKWDLCFRCMKIEVLIFLENL